MPRHAYLDLAAMTSEKLARVFGVMRNAAVDILLARRIMLAARRLKKDREQTDKDDDHVFSFLSFCPSRPRFNDLNGTIGTGRSIDFRGRDRRTTAKTKRICWKESARIEGSVDQNY